MVSSQISEALPPTALKAGAAGTVANDAGADGMGADGVGDAGRWREELLEPKLAQLLPGLASTLEKVTQPQRPTFCHNDMYIYSATKRLRFHCRPPVAARAAPA